MNTATKAIDTTLITIGTGYALSNIHNILGIIILVIQILWIITKVVVKIVKHIKEKKPIEDLDKDMEELINILTETKDKSKHSDEVSADERIDKERMDNKQN